MAHGRGKVILLGEHSVVYGKPALAAGLGLGVDATASFSNQLTEPELICQPWDVTVHPGEDEPLARAFAAVLEGYGQVIPARVHCDIALPGGAGLGCSAALGVAVTGALDELFGVERTDEERGDYSLAWERVFHGTPSGVDNAMAACGGVAVFRRGQPLERVRPRSPLPLIIAHSGESSSTKEIVDHVRQQHEADPERIGEIFDGIESLVLNAKLAVEGGDLRSLGKFMDLNQHLLSALMISTVKLETLCRIARAEGAMGAKLTGAGGGGCMIALAPSMDEAVAIEAALKEHASMTLIAEAGA